MKRLLCTFGVIFSLVSVSLADSAVTMAQTIREFQDIPHSSRYFRSVHSLIDDGALNVSKPFFNPDRAVNRAEAIKMILVSAGRFEEDLDIHGRLRSPFFDVHVQDWYFPYIYTGYRQTLLSGYSDGSFRPSNVVNLAEALKMTFTAFDLELDTKAVPPDIFKADSNAWYTPYFATAKKYNLLADYEYIRPDALVNRGLFAEIVYRVKQAKAGETDYLDIINQPFTITIPRLGVDHVPLQNTDPFDEEYYKWVLTHGIGQALRFPGEGGKIFLYGHSSGYAWDNSPYKTVFRALNKLQKGDEILIEFRGSQYEYIVREQKIINPNDTSVLKDSSGEELAILTCWPPDSLKTRYLIYADPR